METYVPHNIWLLRSYINNREDIDENVPRPAVSGLTGPELHVYINHTEPTDTVNDKHRTNLLSAEKPKIPRLWTPFCVDFRIQICNFVSTACVKALSATSRERGSDRDAPNIQLTCSSATEWPGAELHKTPLIVLLPDPSEIFLMLLF